MSSWPDIPIPAGSACYLDGKYIPRHEAWRLWLEYRKRYQEAARSYPNWVNPAAMIPPLDLTIFLPEKKV